MKNLYQYQHQHSFMKKTVAIFGMFISFCLSMQGQVKELNPISIIKMPTISKAEYNRLSILEDEGKLSEAEKKLMKECAIFDDLYSSSCSWYCGGDVLSIKDSSHLKATKKFNYNGKNAHNFNHESVWAEGAKGQGIGEYLEYVFSGGCPRITHVKILNGHVKDEKVWKDNSRVKKLKMYYMGKPYAILNLQDSRTEQDFEVGVLGPHNPEAPNWTLKFEIMEVYPGDKYTDTVISELWFDGIDVH